MLPPLPRVILAVLLLAGCAKSRPPAESAPAGSPAPEPVVEQSTAPAHAGPAALYPDPGLTPGALDPEATVAKLCTPGYTKTVRHVTAAMRKKVFARYRTAFVPRTYEVDHFISLELGGSNELANLWPEPYEPKPGARQKDTVETALHRDICKGRIGLAQAQDIIRRDWYAYYLEWERGRPAKTQPSLRTPENR